VCVIEAVSDHQHPLRSDGRDESEEMLGQRTGLARERAGAPAVDTDELAA
jgi:hypothetical protein